MMIPTIPPIAKAGGSSMDVIEEIIMPMIVPTKPNEPARKRPKRILTRALTSMAHSLFQNYTRNLGSRLAIMQNSVLLRKKFDYKLDPGAVGAP